MKARFSTRELSKTRATTRISTLALLAKNREFLCMDHFLSIPIHLQRSTTTFTYILLLITTVLEHFAYGGPEFARLWWTSVNMLLQYTSLTHQIEAYLRGDYKDGVLPDDLLVNPIHIPTNVLDHVYFRFPLVETLLSTLAARLSHSRLSHPYGRYTLRNLKQLGKSVIPSTSKSIECIGKGFRDSRTPFYPSQIPTLRIYTS
jgi:hypothetical protein